MVLHLDVWVFHKRKTVEIHDLPGVPTELTFVSPEDAKVIDEQQGGIPTLGQIHFDSDCLVGHFDEWDLAQAAADKKAAELGYKVVDATTLWDDDEEDYEDEDDYDFDDYDDYWDDDDDS